MMDNPIWTKVAAGGNTSIAGYALGGPVGAVAGSMASPVAERFLNEVHRELFARGEIVLNAVVAETAMDTESFLSRLTVDSELKALFARIVLVTSSTALPEKLMGLGRALGRAIVDDARIDEAFCLISALDEMEMPHFRLLETLSIPPAGEGIDSEGTRGWSRTDVLQMRPGMELVGHAILGVLIRHGLVAGQRQSREPVIKVS